MTKPRRHPEQAADEKAAEVAWVRAVLDDTELQRQALGVTENGRCPTCGQPVDDVSSELLDYEKQPGGTMVATTVVFVLLPCGDSFTRRLGAE